MAAFTAFFYALICAIAWSVSGSEVEVPLDSEVMSIDDDAGINLLQVKAEVGPAPVAMPIQADAAAHFSVHLHPSLDKLRDILRPSFLTLPKNVEGNLDPAGVRYALNRYFAHQHGWRIKNLEPEGIECDVSSQTGPLLEVAKEIEERGRSLEEVALLAARIEGLIHLEALERLRVAYKVEGLEVENALSEQQVQGVMSLYMASYVLGGNISNMNHPQAIDMVKQVFTDEYWTRASQFVRDVVNDFDKEDRTAWSWPEVEQLAVNVGDQFGPHRHEEYATLKRTLMSMESRQSQCVPLSKFYGSGMWQFGESADYLTFLGALESSNPRNPNLIIPNYLNAHSNCITVSSFYSVCFVNECDDLIGHLEKKLLTQDASPAQIVHLVRALPSASVAAPRALSISLLQHLEDISAQHGGRVPLHSRLFSQWMHFAFPRECPYAYMSGSTTTLTVDRYENVTGKSPIATKEEMQYYLVAPGFLNKQPQLGKNQELGGTCMPWSTEEEMVVDGVPSYGFDPLGSLLESAAGLAVFVAGIVFTSGLLSLVCTSNLQGSKSVLQDLNCCSPGSNSFDDVDVYSYSEVI